MAGRMVHEGAIAVIMYLHVSSCEVTRIPFEMGVSVCSFASPEYVHVVADHIRLHRGGPAP